MTEVGTIATIRESVDAEGARRIVESIAGAAPAAVERKMYYPYFRFAADGVVRTLFGSKPFAAHCLVDGCNGLGATTDPFEVDEVTVPASAMLGVRTEAAAAAAAARRFVTHNVGRRLRMLANFRVVLEPRGIVYKGFWVARCGGQAVLVDATTGSLHALDHLP